MSEEIKQTGAIIKIANGQINNKIAKDRLRPGELFWLTKHTDGPTNDYVWSDGELLMGCPEGVEDSSYSVIGGTRTGRAVVYQGLITYESEITDELFKHARVGDFWKFDRDATEGTFKYYNFHQNDFLMVTNVSVDPKTGLSSQISFFRVNNSFAETNATTLIFSDPAFEATTVYQAIMELYSNKWQWGGTLSSNEQIIQELAAGTIHEGTVWYELVDNLVFIEPHGTGSLIGKRGDLWLYRGDIDGWTKVITGYTDAEDIDYYADFIQEMMTTFTSKHKDEIAKLSNVKEAIDYILQYKAELGIDGKIPVKQLPDVVFNGMRCGGTWNPILSEDGISGNNIEAQAAWPKFTNDGEEVTRGTYFIINIDNLENNQDSSRVNVQYWDKTQVDLLDNLTRCIELNTGDWVIYTGYQWEKIDNTDRLSGIKFLLNSKKVYGDISEDTPQEVMTAGTPRITSDNKIGLRQENTDIVIGGIRLIDQSIYDEAKDNFVPAYSEGEHNTIRNSHIEDTKIKTIIHQKTEIGQYSEDADISVFGNIILEGTEESRDIVYNFEKNKTTIKAVPATRDNVLLFPNKSGVLATTKDLLVGDGTPGYLPVFIIKKDENDEDILALADSVVHYHDSAIFEKLFENIHLDTFADTDLYKIDFGEFVETYYNAATQPNNLIVDTDVIIGGELDRSLHITKNLSIGNNKTNNTIIVPGREIYSESFAYKQFKQTTKKDANDFDVPAWAIEEKPKGNVYIGLPADSGVLLTTNSPIKGGLYLESDDTVENYEEGVLFRVTDDWENSLGISTHTAVGKDIAYVYKPDQSLNKLDSVTFEGITASKVRVSTLTSDINDILDIICHSIIHVYKDDEKKIRGTISADLYGNADTASEASKLKYGLITETTDEWYKQKKSEYFDGSKPVTHSFYSPDQDVNRNANVEFESASVKDLFVGFNPKSADHDIDFRLLKNRTGITDQWLERQGLLDGRQVSVF